MSNSDSSAWALFKLHFANYYFSCRNNRNFISHFSNYFIIEVFSTRKFLLLIIYICLSA